MYASSDMIDLGLEKGMKWPSKVHRVVAQNLLIGNPTIQNRDTLMDACSEILALTEEQVRRLTLATLREHCPFCAELVDCDRVRNHKEPLP